MKPARLLALGLPLASVPAQNLMIRDGLVHEPHMVTYDAARLRLIVVGRHGETREHDGASWLIRPGDGPRLYGAFAHRLGTGETIAFGASYGGGAETWTYDGAGWRQRSPTVQPPTRYYHAMAYDVVRDRVVLFGGLGTGSLLGDTWEWDGATWRLRASLGPGARRDFDMTYDIARQRTVLFGGTNGSLLGDTWEWDGVVWSNVSPTPSPSPRSGPALAYDRARSRVVLHGGLDLSGASGVSSEVWEYDGVAWQLAAAGGGPGARYEHDLVFDAARNAVVAVGGSDVSTGQADHHAWNGSNWQPVVTVPPRPRGDYGTRTAPNPLAGGAILFNGTTWLWSGGAWMRAPAAVSTLRVEPAMWSDGTRTWLFGGRDLLAGFFFNDLARWNGTNWIGVPAPNGPSPRSLAAVAYDPLRGHAVLFGGAGFSAFGDTWTFDGATWQQLSPSGSPTPRFGAGMAFDPTLARIVLFGGTRAGWLAQNDTWSWNRSTWTSIPTATRPPAREFAALAFDPRTAQIVLAHAADSGSLVPTPIDVWMFDGVDWSPLPLLESRVAGEHLSVLQPSGSATLLVSDGAAMFELVHSGPRTDPLGAPCGAAAPELAGRVLPEPGAADFGIDLIDGPPSNLFAIGAALASGNTPIGACTLRLGAPFVTALGFTSGTGFATHRVPVPPQSGLVGVNLFFQAAVLQPANPGGVDLSSAIRVVVGG